MTAPENPSRTRGLPPTKSAAERRAKLSVMKRAARGKRFREKSCGRYEATRAKRKKQTTKEIWVASR
jgi:hypothetical protein